MTYMSLYNENGYLKVKLNDNVLIQGNKKMLELWLTDDVSGDEFILKDLDDVISNKKSLSEFDGNLCHVIVDKDYADIHCIYEESSSELKPCKLPTKMLREIVAIWLEEYKKLHSR